MTPVDELAFLAGARSPLARLHIEPACPGQSGSSGVVLPAVDTEADRRFALKLVRGRIGEDADMAEAARADALAQTDIDHPRIADLHESGQMPAGFYLLMAWLEGRPLDALLREGPMDPWAALTVARDVADAVETACARGIVHRDLTPAKIVVDEDGHAALGDLGAGRRRAGEPLPGPSLDYLSPEHVRDEPLTAASHEYGLACILFHCLAGEAPFARARASAKTFWHVRAPRPEVTRQRAGLPPELDEALARGMAIEPADRHGSPQALVAAVGAALGPPPANAGGAPASPAHRARGGVRAPAVRPNGARPPALRPGGARPAASGADAFHAWRVGDDGEPDRPASAPGPAATAPAGRLNWIDDASGPGRLAWLAGGVASLVAAGAIVAGGVMAGKEAKDPPPAAQPGAVGTSQLALVRPAGWRALDPVPLMPGFDDAEVVAVGPPNAGAGAGAIVAGVVQPGRDGLLPDALLDDLERAPGRGEPVELGDLEGFRFRNLDRRGAGGRLTLYAVPTDDGTATVVCLGGSALGGETCDQQAATLQLTGPDPEAVQPAKDYAQTIVKAFRDLNGRRTDVLAALRSADTRTAQSRAAKRLAGAYRATAGKIRTARGQRWVQDANTGIVAALEASGAAYGSMAYNAGRGDEAGYAAARQRAIAADRRVERALRRLEAAGYRVR